MIPACNRTVLSLEIAGKDRKHVEENKEILPGYPIETYLRERKNANWNDDTRASYRRILYELQQYLAGRSPDAKTLCRWQQDLHQNGYRTQSINIRLSAANNYFRWCGRYDLVMHHRPADAAPSPELTRCEYLRLLRAARKRGWRQVYLLVKLFVITGIPLQCLEQITPQIVQAGHAMLVCRNGRFALYLPESLRLELLAYSKEEHLVTGPVFVTRGGRPVNRSNLCRKLQELCREAGIPEEKGSPRCLRNLCQATKDALYANMEQQLRQMYDLLLQVEQESVGWSVRP